MTGTVGVGQPAWHLVLDIVLITWSVGEVIWRFISWLNLCHIVIDRGSLDTWRGSCLETTNFESQFLEIVSKVNRSQTVVRTWRILEVSDDDFPTECSPCRHDNSFSSIFLMGSCTHTDNLTIFHQNFINHGLTKGEIFLIFNCLAHLLRVKLLVSLRTKGTDSWTFPSIEHLHLDVSLVNGFGHLATEGIDFTHDNPLGRTTDWRVTRHESQHFNVDGRKQDLTAHTAGC